MSLLDDVTTCLASDRREEFLARLAHNLTISARATYVESGKSTEEASAGLRCHNELLHTAAGRLRDAVTGEYDWSDEEFVRALVGKARAFGGCEAELHWALERSLRMTSASK